MDIIKFFYKCNLRFLIFIRVYKKFENRLGLSKKLSKMVCIQTEMCLLQGRVSPIELIQLV